MTLVVIPYKIAILFTNYFDLAFLVSSEALVTNWFNHPYILLAVVLSVLSTTNPLRGSDVVGVTENKSCCQLKATSTKTRHICCVC